MNVPRRKLISAKTGIEESSFRDWLSNSVNTFWFSGFDRISDSRNSDDIIETIESPSTAGWVIDDAYGRGIAVVGNCEWETKVLNLPVAKLDYFAADDYQTSLALAQKINQHAKSQQVLFLSALPGVSPAFVSVALEQHGFRVAAQYYRWKVNTHKASAVAGTLKSRYSFKIAKRESMESVGALAKRAFVHGRYAADPRISRDLGSQLYGAWGNNSCLGYADATLIYESQKSVLGFVAAKVHEDGSSGRIDLLAVDESSRSLGLGTALLARVCEWFADQGIDSIEVTTEKPNLEMNRIYRRFGFTIYDSDIVLHWFNSEMEDD